MTRELFREDSYLKTCQAEIQSITDAGVQTDQSVFYPLGGGQLGDTGWLLGADGSRLDISNTQKDRDSGIQYHIIEPNHSLS
ncbi:MAG: alanine--tRNA ligase-related protein, partial [Granulosicoccus sp.]